MDNDRKRMIFDIAVLTSSGLFAGLLFATAAFASGKSLAAANPTYSAECGSCHIAYPPALLPANAWQAVLGGLEKHFGTDATVDAKSLAEIRAFVERHAGRDRSATAAGKPLLRITDTTWFRREHDEVPASTWRNEAVKRPANCAACHTGAERGDFGERGIRVPK